MRPRPRVGEASGIGREAFATMPPRSIPPTSKPRLSHRRLDFNRFGTSGVSVGEPFFVDLTRKRVLCPSATNAGRSHAVHVMMFRICVTCLERVMLPRVCAPCFGFTAMTFFLIFQRKLPCRLLALKDTPGLILCVHVHTSAMRELDLTNTPNTSGIYLH